MNDKQLLFQINEFLKKYCAALATITDFFNGQQVKGENKNAIGLLFEFVARASSNLYSIQRIIEFKNDSIRNEHSLGLLLRSALFDSIIIHYLNVDSEENGKIDYSKFEKSVLIILSAHVPRAFNEHHINEPNLIQKFKFYMIKKDKRFISAHGKELTIKDYIDSIKLKKTDIKYSKIYDYWEIYSKYEHFGLFTRLIQTQRNEINISRLAFSLEFVLTSINLIIDNLKSINPAYIQNEAIDFMKAGYMTYLEILNEHGMVKIKNVC